MNENYSIALDKGIYIIACKWWDIKKKKIEKTLLSKTRIMVKFLIQRKKKTKTKNKTNIFHCYWIYTTHGGEASKKKNRIRPSKSTIF